MRSFEARDEKGELEQAKLRKDLGMPIRLIAEGLGLTQDQLALWEQEAARASNAAQNGAQQATGQAMTPADMGNA